MASPTTDLTAFAQDVYLVIKNRFFDDITSEDGQLWVQQVASWVNMYLDELETTVDPGDPQGNLVDWWFSRASGVTLGTAALNGTSIASLPSTVSRLVVEPERFVQVVASDGTVISNWAVVHPKDFSNKTDPRAEDRCAMVGNSLLFSRPFNDKEAGKSIIGDVINPLPRIVIRVDAEGNVTATSVKAFTTVQPLLLLKLGVAKNATLPDIVQGVLSPSYTQKFNDLLNGAVARSTVTSRSATASRQKFGNIGGV